MIQVRFLLGMPTGSEPVTKVRTVAKRRTEVRRFILQGDEVFLLGIPTGSEPVMKVRTVAERRTEVRRFILSAVKVFIMKNKAVKIGIIASILPHLFCCILPIALSVVSLFVPEVAHAEFIPRWFEPWLFVFSGLMLCLSWVLVFRDCHCDCEQCHGSHNHRAQKIIIGVITLIFIISIILHLMTHH